MAHFPKAACDCSARHRRAVKTSLRSQAMESGAAFSEQRKAPLSIGLDSAMPRANLRLRLLGKNARAAVEHLFARA